ncbi:membrane-bound lytic murein transglycosylase MltF [Acidihalobacter prosperus]|uniref:Membrane-bound lytic murein transglycosylase F n=1 Tax=Acidihalobacter prosperus TaxID=160660 RepID=A0A1A6C8P0_9GAMM|nr:membrane-bound lytic murein transglycosylase MltF [Acidihalobacter prosperus]OBS10915.1 lytic transglycosylase F [Acidihalobacter prosperus]
MINLKTRRGRRQLIRIAEIAAFIALMSTTLVYVLSRTPDTLLDRIKASGVLVVATRNGPTTYYQGPDGPTGFDYDLVEAFAHELGVKVKWVFPDNFSDLLPMVESGRVDMVAAGIAITPGRAERVRFGPAYQTIRQEVIYRAGEPRPRSVSDLIGKRLAVIAGSSFETRLRQLKKKYPQLGWQAESDTDIEELLYQVATGKLDYTLDDSNDVTLNRRFYPQIAVAFSIGSPQKLAWAFRRDDDSSLYHAAKAFFAKIEKNGELHRITERYYGHARSFDYVGTFTFMKHVAQRLPPLIPLFKAAAKKYHISWRLLAAISYQESHWNPNATSPTGVRGLMMLTRPTAEHLDVENRLNPEQSIMGGTRYFLKLRRELPASIKEPDRTWFALAAYNIGLGHVMDARRLAVRFGKNPNSWPDVKQILPLLSQRRWYRQTKFGYARGREPVQYVQNIRSYFDILIWLRDHNQKGQNLNTPLPSSLLNTPPSL